MGALKAYVYLALLTAIGVIFLATGAAEFWHLLSVALRRQRLFGAFIPLLIHALQMGLGVGLLLRRGRALAAAYCLVVVISALLPIDIVGTLLRDPYFASFPYPLFFLASFVLLFLPAPRIPVGRAPAEPTGRAWRKWLVASLQCEGVQPVRDRFGLGFLKAAVPYAFVLALVAVVFPLGYGVGGPLGIVLVVLVCVGFAFLPRAFFGIAAKVGGESYRNFVVRTAQVHLQARGAEEELQRPGSRRPILYLRAFTIDDRSRQEQSVVGVLRKIGPVIAIGRPGEEFPPLGAARFYVDEAHWQAKIADVVRVAQLVIWVTGTTEGLKWELNHLRQSLAPEKLILWAHPHVLGLTGAAAEAEWMRFREMLGSIIPAPLPRELGNNQFFHFDKDWKQTWSISGQGTDFNRLAIEKILASMGMAKPIVRRRRIKLAYEVTIITIFGMMVLFALGTLFLD